MLFFKFSCTASAKRCGFGEEPVFSYLPPLPPKTKLKSRKEDYDLSGLVGAIFFLHAIEGFGGKRAVGILRKIELCQKRCKFRIQFCLGVLNNVLHVFSLKLASFLRYYVCEKTHFSEGIL